jgi:transcriptional regulator with XRE-family HTH domain
LSKILDTAAMIEIGQKLRAIRQALGMSVEAFAEKIGASRSMAYNWENGVGQPSYRKLERVRQALGKGYDWLLSDVESLEDLFALIGADGVARLEREKGWDLSAARKGFEAVIPLWKKEIDERLAKLEGSKGSHADGVPSTQPTPATAMARAVESLHDLMAILPSETAEYKIAFHAASELRRLSAPRQSKAGQAVAPTIPDTAAVHVSADADNTTPLDKQPVRRTSQTPPRIPKLHSKKRAP